MAVFLDMIYSCRISFSVQALLNFVVLAMCNDGKKPGYQTFNKEILFWVEIGNDLLHGVLTVRCGVCRVRDFGDPMQHASS